MEAAVALRALPAPPINEAVMSVADVDEIKRGQEQALAILGQVREDVASLKTGMVNQAERTALFWSKDWKDLTDWRHEVDVRLGKVEKAENVSKGSIVTLKWTIATGIAALGLAAAVTGTVIGILHIG